jgi:hypothetical protein
MNSVGHPERSGWDPDTEHKLTYTHSASKGRHVDAMHIVENSIIILGVVMSLDLYFIERTLFEAPEN